jgi:hypothetical protein
VIDELAIPATEIENRGDGMNEARKKPCNEDLPNLIPIVNMGVESVVVDSVQFVW